MGTRDLGFTTTELADYRATRRIVVRVNGWVQLTPHSCGSGMGTVVKPNAGL